MYLDPPIHFGGIFIGIGILLDVFSLLWVVFPYYVRSFHGSHGLESSHRGMLAPLTTTCSSNGMATVIHNALTVDCEKKKKPELQKHAHH